MILIQNHHSRDVEQSAEDIRSLGYECQVVTDTTDYYQSKGALKHKGQIKNFLRMLEIGAKSKDDAVLMLQDDIDVSEPALRDAFEIQKLAPADSVISLYDHYNKTVAERIVGGKHVKASTWIFTVGWITTPAKLAKIAKWIRDNTITYGAVPDDFMLCNYAMANKEVMYTVYPNLVQHMKPDDSVLGNKAETFGVYRVSPYTVEGFDMSKIDWKKEFNNPIRRIVKQSHLKNGTKYGMSWESERIKL